MDVSYGTIICISQFFFKITSLLGRIIESRNLSKIKKTRESWIQTMSLLNLTEDQTFVAIGGPKELDFIEYKIIVPSILPLLIFLLY